MANNNALHDQEEPLDPKVEAIRVKMVRLLMVSGGIMFLGFMAVMAAIVYKWNSLSSSNPTPGAPAAEVMATEEETLLVPKGAKIISTSSAGMGLVLTIQLPDGKTIIQRYDSSGRMTSRFSVIEE